MKKIKFNELIDVRPFETKQGGSWSSLYEGVYNNESVIIKAQDKGSLAKTDPVDDRFIQEKEILELKIPGTVDALGWGDDFNGERFVVLERLFEIPPLLNDKKVQELANILLITTRQLYLFGYHWTSNIHSILINRNNEIKLVDFNDDKPDYKRNFFLDNTKYHNYFKLIHYFCNENDVDVNVIYPNSISNLLATEYQSLENVHEPIYFSPFENILRRETETNDANFNTLVPPNRICIDRALMIEKALEKYGNNLSFLDIGCNTGWFCFYFKEKGFKTVGIDFDKPGDTRPLGWNKKSGGKIEFVKLLTNLYNTETDFREESIDKETAADLEEYDVVIILSLLHLYFTQHKVSKSYWIEMVKEICNKTKKALIFETSSTTIHTLGCIDSKELSEYVKNLGGFSTARVLGTGETGRDVIICER